MKPRSLSALASSWTSRLLSTFGGVLVASLAGAGCSDQAAASLDGGVSDGTDGSPEAPDGGPVDGAPDGSAPLDAGAFGPTITVNIEPGTQVFGGLEVTLTCAGAEGCDAISWVSEPGKEPGLDAPFTPGDTLTLVLGSAEVVDPQSVVLKASGRTSGGLVGETAEFSYEFTGLPSCGEVRFDHLPIEASSIASIAPIDTVVPGGNHVFPVAKHYIAPKDGEEPTVVAPADAYLTRLSRVEWGDPITGHDSAMIFQLTCSDMKLGLAHVTTASPALLAAIDFESEADCSETGSGAERVRSCRWTGRHRVDAGDVLGSKGGPMNGSGADALDYSLFDRRNPIQLLHEDEPRSEVCLLPYHAPGALRDSIAGLLNCARDSCETTADLCGSYDLDIAGTAQGFWFEDTIDFPFAGDPSIENQQLVLYSDAARGNEGYFSTASSMLDVPGYRFIDSTIGLRNRAFSSVATPGQTYCYDGLMTDQGPPIAGIIMLQLVSPTRVRIQRIASAPTCPANDEDITSFIFDAGLDYVRLRAPLPAGAAKTGASAAKRSR